jgi:hypothetical protein
MLRMLFNMMTYLRTSQGFLTENRAPPSAASVALFKPRENAVLAIF